MRHQKLALVVFTAASFVALLGLSTRSVVAQTPVVYSVSGKVELGKRSNIRIEGRDFDPETVAFTVYGGRCVQGCTVPNNVLQEDGGRVTPTVIEAAPVTIGDYGVFEVEVHNDGRRSKHKRAFLLDDPAKPATRWEVFQHVLTTHYLVVNRLLTETRVTLTEGFEIMAIHVLGQKDTEYSLAIIPDEAKCQVLREEQVNIAESPNRKSLVDFHKYHHLLVLSAGSKKLFSQFLSCVPRVPATRERGKQ